jgi:cold shock CspA family protein
LEKSSAISIVVNGGRWLQEGDALVSSGGTPRRWTLDGLKDFVGLRVGAQLGRTLDQIEFVDLRWCRDRANGVDNEAVNAGFTVVNAPHVGADDAGAGLSLEAVEAALSGCQAVVVVGALMTWLPLRQKLEASGIALFELLLPASGKVIVSTDHVVDLRENALRQHGSAPTSALFKALPAAVSTAATGEPTAPAPRDASFAANAILGIVKSKSNGYGIVTRKDGLGDLQFLPGHVAPPGFEYVEVGDVVRFDVVKSPAGKWLAQRVVRS